MSFVCLFEKKILLFNIIHNAFYLKQIIETKMVHRRNVHANIILNL